LAAACLRIAPRSLLCLASSLALSSLLLCNFMLPKSPHSAVGACLAVTDPCTARLPNQLLVGEGFVRIKPMYKINKNELEIYGTETKKTISH
jgi:hypothetical protein